MRTQNLLSFDQHLIHFFRTYSLPAARWGLFIVFFWFGLLKLLGMSPAEPLVEQLYYQTIPFIPFAAFYASFAILECAIGILFLFKGMERLVLPLLFIHLITTFLPLFLLPEATWQATMVPTMTGQYIIKNVLIIATAMGIAAHLHPLQRD
jgi:uncharacterized membrane protein YkgB